MTIKSVSFVFFLLTISFAGLIVAHGEETIKTQCTGKVAKQRQPLFIQAEKYEEDFMNAQKQCLQASDCDINPIYKIARQTLLYTTACLTEHLEALEQKTDGACHVCEKTEAKDIKKRLTELLKTAP